MGNCDICRNELTRTQRKYCSNKCKQKAHYEKSKSQRNSYHQQHIRSLNRKMKLIEMRGSCCENCGYNKNLAAFDFHHRDGNLKESKLDMRVLSNRNWDFIMKEFEKCDLLCANCHREVHNPHLEMDEVNKTLNEYKKITKKFREIKKPKCLDCQVEINYTSKRCANCELKRRKKEKPDMDVLINECKTMTRSAMSKKYNVSRTTIRRWLGEI